MVDKVLSLKKKHRIAVAWAQDSNTISAIHRSVKDGFAEAIMIGQPEGSRTFAATTALIHGLFSIMDSDNETNASEKAVKTCKDR